MRHRVACQDLQLRNLGLMHLRKEFERNLMLKLQPLVQLRLNLVSQQDPNAPSAHAEKLRVKRHRCGCLDRELIPGQTQLRTKQPFALAL